MMTTNRDTIGEIHTYGVDVKNREVYINEYDDSGETAGVDHRMVQNFVKNINFNDKKKSAFYLKKEGK